MGPMWLPPPKREPLKDRVRRLARSRALLIAPQSSWESVAREPKAIWLSEAEWSVRMPQRYTYFGETINNTFANETLYMALLVRVEDFLPRSAPGLRLTVIANISVSEGSALYITLWFIQPRGSRLLVRVPTPGERMTLREALENACLRDLKLVAHGARENATHLATYFKCAPRELGLARYGITMSVECGWPDEAHCVLSVVLELLWASSREVYRIYLPVLINMTGR